MTKGKLLVIVDMQNDFIDGALKNPDAQGNRSEDCKED